MASNKKITPDELAWGAFLITTVGIVLYAGAVLIFVI